MAPSSSSLHTCGERGERVVSCVREKRRAKGERDALRDPRARLKEENVGPEDKLQDEDVPDAHELAQAAVACRVA